ncbi:MAG: NUDIX domain-containing protein [Magnetococcales bacterium]|nr:NUDIX domain-containing protein [Magnetococcales bacterium]
MLVKATISAHALIVDQSAIENGLRVLMVRLAYRDHRWRTWSFPGGYVDENETLESALAREVVEEVGVVLKQTVQVQTVPIIGPEKKPHVGFLFRCDAWEGEPTRVSHELLEVAWFTESDFHQKARESKLAYAEMCNQVSCLGWTLPERSGSCDQY